MDRFHSGNQLPGFQPVISQNFLAHKSRKNGLLLPRETKISHTEAFETKNIRHETASVVSNNILPWELQQAPPQTQEPIIPAEGRRKRRRIEDAFQNLSLWHEDVTVTTPDNNYKQPGAETNQARRVTEQKFNFNGASLSETPMRSNEVAFMGATGNTNTVTPSTTWKKLFPDASETKIKSQSECIDNPDFSLHSNLSYVPGESRFKHDGKTDSLMEDDLFSKPNFFHLEEDDDDGNNSCSSVSSSSCGTPVKNPPLRSHHYHQPLPNTLFAPRKSKSNYFTEASGTNTLSNNPVDARIEELIRHTRIRAMVQASIDKENNGKKKRVSGNNRDDFLMGVKNQNDEDKGLNRNYNGYNIDIQRKHTTQQHASMVTRDDFDLRVSNGNGIRNTDYLSGNRRQLTNGAKVTHERGRKKVIQSDTRSGHNEAKERRSKSLPKQTKYYTFVHNRNHGDKRVSADNEMM